MPLPDASTRGPDVEKLTLAINGLAASMGPIVAKTFAGSLSVGNLSPDFPLNAASLTEVDFSLVTAPTGSAAQFDVLTSSDGSTFVSATGGAGVTIPAGQTSGSITFAQQPLSGSNLVRISVLAVGSSVPGATLTVTVTGSVL